MKKTKIKEKEFNSVLGELKSVVKFFNISDYEMFLAGANKFSPGERDVDFFALSLKEKCFLWSNDSLLKKQDRVKVLNTEEIISVVF